MVEHTQSKKYLECTDNFDVGDRRDVSRPDNKQKNWSTDAKVKASFGNSDDNLTKDP